MKPSTLAWLLVAAWPVFSGPAWAQTADAHAIDDQLQKCLDDPDKSSTGDQDDCITAADQAWDALLNQDYKRLGDRLTGDGGTALRTAQRAWLRSRDADRALVDAVYATTRGTMYAPMNATDTMEVTARRARQFDAYLAALDGAKPEMPTLPDFDNPADNGAPLPHRAADAAKHCADATDLCVKRLDPLYAQDLMQIDMAMSHRLPRPARAKFEASKAAWAGFRERELALIEVLPPEGAGARRLNLAVDRLTLLDGTLGMIGRD